MRLMVKFKTLDYCLRHRAKDSIYNERNLAEIVLLDKLDDIYPLVKEDANATSYINNFRDKIIGIKSMLEVRVTVFYTLNSHLERKDYAIKAQENDKDIMGLLMNAWMSRPVDINEYILKNEVWKNKGELK